MAGAFLPLSVTGVYSVGVQFASAIGTASSAINGAYNPILQSNFVKQDFASSAIRLPKPLPPMFGFFLSHR